MRNRSVYFGVSAVFLVASLPIPALAAPNKPSHQPSSRFWLQKVARWKYKCYRAEYRTEPCPKAFGFPITKCCYSNSITSSFPVTNRLTHRSLKSHRSSLRLGINQRCHAKQPRLIQAFPRTDSGCVTVGTIVAKHNVRLQDKPISRRQWKQPNNCLVRGRFYLPSSIDTVNPHTTMCSDHYSV